MFFSKSAIQIITIAINIGTVLGTNTTITFIEKEQLLPNTLTTLIEEEISSPTPTPNTSNYTHSNFTDKSDWEDDLEIIQQDITNLKLPDFEKQFEDIHHLNQFLDSVTDRKYLLSSKLYVKSTKTYFSYAIDNKTSKNLDSFKLLELNYGPKKLAILNNAPLSKCASSTKSSGDISMTINSGWTASFSHTIGLNPSYNITGTSYLPIFEFGIDVSNTHTLSGSVTCASESKGKVQILTTLRYVYFPKCKGRFYTFNKKEGGLKLIENWNPVYSSKDHKEYGMVLYDNSRGDEYACANKDEFLKCDDNILSMDSMKFDPVIGLDMAMND